VIVVAAAPKPEAERLRVPVPDVAFSHAEPPEPLKFIKPANGVGAKLMTAVADVAVIENFVAAQACPTAGNAGE
jgi:hypothetical protein